MKHRVYGKHLGRNKDERDNLFRGLVQALLTHGTIQTSETKAKAIKPLIDKVINSAKDKQIKGQFASYVLDENLRKRLTDEIVPKMATRNSGYTKIVRIGTRLGDQTTVVSMSLIGAEELKPVESRVKSQESSEKIRKPQKTEKKTAVKTKKPQEVVKVAKSKRGGKNPSR